MRWNGLWVNPLRRGSPGLIRPNLHQIGRLMLFIKRRDLSIRVPRTRPLSGLPSAFHCQGNIPALSFHLIRRLTGRVTQSLRGVKSGSLGRGEAGLLEFGSFICTPEWRLINASPGCGKTLARIFGFFPPHCIIQQAKVFNISQTAAGRHKICFYCEALPGSGPTRNLLLFFLFNLYIKNTKINRLGSVG